MNHIITISREFGSGGRTVGKKVAEQLGIPCYDSELIQKIAVGTSVVAVLPWKAAVVLVALATVLTILGGFIPAKTASRSDPVKALRAE